MEQKLTELSTRIAQNQVIAMAKTEERLKAAETAAATVLHKIKLESSALKAIQERIEQDALAVERAIAREAVEAMAVEAALARIRTDEAAIAQASRKIREEIETTKMIQDCFDEEIPSDTVMHDKEQGDTHSSDDGEALLAATEERMAAETSGALDGSDDSANQPESGMLNDPVQSGASGNSIESNDTEVLPDKSETAEIE